MKKILTSLIVLSVFFGTSLAFADDTTALTTKNYVDLGLKAVYKAATDAQADVDALEADFDTLAGTVDSIDSTVSGHTTSISNLQTTVGDNASGLVKDVADLKAAAATNDTTAYTQGTGITIDDHQISVTGLDTTKAEGNTNKRYIYQNGVLTELEVANTWNPSILED